MEKLPAAFLERMKKLLGDEFSLFRESLAKKRHYGLRANTLKLAPQELKQLTPFHLTPIPWVKSGFFYHEDDQPGKHYYHNAGLYYIQEPSAMFPAVALEAKPGERVLDLCAAPGGKTTQIAGDLQGKGVIVANDISLKRARVLAMNIERMGVKNAFITNETPQRLANFFPAFFDRILVDAPCSGEGMFRKMPESTAHWSLDSITDCRLMQADILEHAATMLKPGGVLVYSTCTFAPEENEGSIQHFLDKHQEFAVLRIPPLTGFQPGRPDWLEQGDANLEKTLRLWPHYLAGEGHYIAKLRKIDGVLPDSLPEEDGLLANNLPTFTDFCTENLVTSCQGKFTTFGPHLYLTPPEIPRFSGLKVLRPGWYLGELKKNRFQPAHGFAMGLNPRDFCRTISLSDVDLISGYLRGQTLQISGENGWTLLEVAGFPLGWGKMVNGILKNHYPRSMRWLF